MAEQVTTDVVTKNKWRSLWVLALGLSMVVVDGTIVGVALPVIITDLQLNLTDAQWVTALYSVVFAALLLGAGRLGDQIGRRKVFLGGVTVFVGGSLLAAAASSAVSLILARVIQGVGGAMVLPGTLSTVNATFRGKDRAAAFGIWGAVIAGMAAIGPLLGGWLTTSFTWPWIFLVNLPLGILVFIAAVAFVPETRGSDNTGGWDPGGLVLGALAFGSLVFGLIEGSNLGWWTPVKEFSVLGMTWPATAVVSIVPVLIVLGVLLTVLFWRWDSHRRRQRSAVILDLGLFTKATFRWGNSTAFLVAIGEFGLLFVLPLYLVNARGLSTFQAGWVLSAMATGAFISGAQARHLAARFGSGRVVNLGLGLEILGIGGLIPLVLGGDIAIWIVGAPLVVYGVGLGLASAQLTGVTLSEVPPDQSGQGSATQSTVRQLGAAFGAAILGAVLSIGIAQTVHLDGIPDAQASQLITATRQSAGGVIGVIRDGKFPGESGDAGSEIADQLATGFSKATAISLGAAGLVLSAALIASLRVTRAMEEADDHLQGDQDLSDAASMP